MVIRRGVRPARTHALEELLAAARGAGATLPELHADCKLLTPYAVDVRYPAATPVTVEGVRAAVAAAERIVAAAEGLVR